MGARGTIAPSRRSRSRGFEGWPWGTRSFVDNPKATEHEQELAQTRRQKEEEDMRGAVSRRPDDPEDRDDETEDDG